MTHKISPLTSAGILFAATMGIAISGIHFHVVGAMVTPLNTAYGWTRGDIAFALTIATLVNPIANIYVGSLAGRHGARRVALPGIALFAIGTALMGAAGPTLWSWYAAYLVFAIIGSGASSIVWTMSVVEHFNKRRGIALAVSLAGAGVLVSAVPSIVLVLERAVGLRGIYPALGLASFFLMFIPAWLFLPRDNVVERSAARNHPDAERSNWREVAASGIIWRLGLALLLIAACIGTFIVHFQPMLTDSGLTRESAAYIALFLGPAMITGRIATGFLFDLLPARLVATVAFSLPGIACLMLYGVPLNITTASALAILIGVGMGSEVDVVAYLSSRYFPLRQYGIVFGALISAYGLAIGIASWLVGAVYDASGNYDSVLLALAGGVVVALVLVVSLGKPPPVAATSP